MSTAVLNPELRARAVRLLQRKKPLSWTEKKDRIANADGAWRGNPINKLKLFRNPSVTFSPGVTTRQNRVNEHGLRRIPTYPHRPAGVKPVTDHVGLIEQEEIIKLDPSGRRTGLFAKGNPQRVKPGDTLMVKLKNGDPFSGVCISIRQRHAKVDWAILLRNHITRVPTEMWFKIYSPNIEGIEVVQRAVRRARRLRLYYMRKPKHDKGSVENVVRQYMRQKADAAAASKNAAKAPIKKKQKQKQKQSNKRS